MARKTFHRKDGRFSSFIAAHSVIDSGKRYEVVRTLKQVGGIKGDDAKGDTQATPRVDVAGGIQAAKGKAAMVAGAVSRGGWVPIGAFSPSASAPASVSAPAPDPASEEVIDEKGR